MPQTVVDSELNKNLVAKEKDEGALMYGASFNLNKKEYHRRRGIRNT
jgi:hypothetical protein